MRKRHSTDLTDKQWKIIKPLVPPAKEGGRPRATDRREVNQVSIPIAEGPAASRGV